MYALVTLGGGSSSQALALDVILASRTFAMRTAILFATVSALAMPICALGQDHHVTIQADGLKWSAQGLMLRVPSSPS
jgi:hypothetical protein